MLVTIEEFGQKI